MDILITILGILCCIGVLTCIIIGILFGFYIITEAIEIIKKDVND